MSHHDRTARAISLAACALIVTSAHAQTPELDAITRLQNSRTGCLATKDAKKQAGCLDAVAAEALALADRLAPRPKPEPAIDPEAAARSAFLTKARQVLVRDFKDPDSVKLRDAFIAKLNGSYALCGELNAKNSYGAYGGFNRFWVTPDPWEYTLDDSGKNKFSFFPEQWTHYCSEKLMDVN